MAIDLMDEHEQGERVRAWLRDNGGAIVGGIALGLAGIVGWQWWGQSKVEHRLDAATQYQALIEAVERSDRDASDRIGASLADEFSDTPYAALAALKRAEQFIAAGETAGAVEALEKSIGLARDPALAGLARLRLARLQLGNGQPEPALKALDGVSDEAYAGIASEIRGDALMALGRSDEARAAFAAAAAAYDALSPARRLVELKLTDLGGSVPTAESEVES